MIDNINFGKGISSSLLRTAQAALAEIPHKFQEANRHTTTLLLPHSRSRKVKRDLGLAGAKRSNINPQTRISAVDVEVNPSQWLLSGNPLLANLVTQTIGDRWITHLEDLQQLIPLAGDLLFQSRWRAVKQVNKHALASYLERSQGVRINVSSLFDLQLQPIVEHQRQLLNILHIIALFHQIKREPSINILPRTFIFGDLGELESSEIEIEIDADPVIPANPNQAIVALIQSLAKILASDPDVSDTLQVVYIPNSARLTSQMYAAADLTQQIRTATIEDLDLGTLQATINGVLSIGSLGKTNHWLQQLVGEQNYFCFGLSIPEIALFEQYGYDPYNYYKHYAEIRQSIDCLLTGYFTPDHPSLCQSILNNLFGVDEQMVLADYIFYAACQARVSETYVQKSIWTKMSILNVAGIG
jgi:glycogen phosphorylase